MKIIIPMSGSGNRFIKGGYTTPKPLIEVDGKPMIEHVVNLFPGETKFVFGCKDEHLKTTNMREILQRIAPQGKIISMPSSKEVNGKTLKGPVFATSLMFDHIDDNEEVIVNYCDFSTYWDYADFLKHTRSRKADGAIPSYKGFHPHMLGSTNYAFIRDDKQWLQEIKEKEPFTNNRMQEYASNGTYYFSKGAYVKKYFQELMDRDINLKGEFYVSLIYNLMQRDGLKTSVYEIQHMLQWGIPEDVEIYQNWSNYFADVIKQKPAPTLANTKMVIPMAGLGKRFADVGYLTPKPLIPVSGKPMIVQATNSLPHTDEHTFVCLKQHLEEYPEIKKTLEGYSAKSNVVQISCVTQGQACTAELGITEEDLDKPLIIGACDNGMLFDHEKFQQLIRDTNVEAVAFSFRNHPSSKQNPEMYGWIETNEHNNVQSVSVKKAISETPEKDHAIVGAFYFASARLFIKAAHALYKDCIRINNEFYIDSCIDMLAKMGHGVKVFEVDHYVCWGTPNDYKTFEYWQSFFHKCWWHPYSLEKDPSVAPEAASALDKKYRSFQQEHRDNTSYSKEVTL